MTEARFAPAIEDRFALAMAALGPSGPADAAAFLKAMMDPLERDRAIALIRTGEFAPGAGA